MTIELLELTPSHLERLLRGDQRLGPLEIADGALPPEFILRAALGVAHDETALSWLAPRLFVSSVQGVVVGSGGFKGPPTDGAVEIGYNVAASARGQGFATQAVRQLVQWAFETPDVLGVYAETAVDNPASRRVIEKAGFTQVGRRETVNDGHVDCWTLEKHDT